eukprot:4349370-Prymnesium_polylepis.1
MATLTYGRRRADDVVRLLSARLRVLFRLARPRAQDARYRPLLARRERRQGHRLPAAPRGA